ncbi:hypothetical protein GCM10010170_107790 [Dactylosporangium salmoneum]|uniref:UspA domain-containing protein n=1 Tax=Dactylosporangium salmoneum TaxID=53361 RepID=A0ABP5V8G3_9ACTN
MGTALPVVVGTDGSPESLDAVVWAAVEAEVRRRPLRIVHAFVWPTVYAPFAAPVPAPYESGIQEAAAQILDEAAERARFAAPRADVETEIRMQQPGARAPRGGRERLHGRGRPPRPRRVHRHAARLRRGGPGRARHLPDGRRPARQ